MEKGEYFYENIAPLATTKGKEGYDKYKSHLKDIEKKLVIDYEKEVKDILNKIYPDITGWIKKKHFKQVNKYVLEGLCWHYFIKQSIGGKLAITDKGTWLKIKLDYIDELFWDSGNLNYNKAYYFISRELRHLDHVLCYINHKLALEPGLINKEQYKKIKELGEITHKLCFKWRYEEPVDPKEVEKKLNIVIKHHLEDKHKYKDVKEWERLRDSLIWTYTYDPIEPERVLELIDDLGEIIYNIERQDIKKIKMKIKERK